MVTMATILCLYMDGFSGANKCCIDDIESNVSPETWTTWQNFEAVSRGIWLLNVWVMMNTTDNQGFPSFWVFFIHKRTTMKNGSFRGVRIPLNIVNDPFGYLIYYLVEYIIIKWSILYNFKNATENKRFTSFLFFNGSLKRSAYCKWSFLISHLGGGGVYHKMKNYP